MLRGRRLSASLAACAVATAVALGFASDASAAGAAGGEAIALGEIATPPETAGIDRDGLALAAAGELSAVEVSRAFIKKKRRFVVSLAMTEASASPPSCTIQAMLRDAKTGTMIAVLAGRARTDAAATAAVRLQVARAAVRSALVQIPAALASGG